MKKFFTPITILFISSVIAFSQKIDPTPKPTPPDDNDVVKISTNLIQIDVSVTDSSGKVVKDLRPDEIEIYENGKKQDISNFSFISAPGSAAVKGKPANRSALPIPPTELRAEKIQRTIALVVDDLTLSFPSTASVRYALRKFVNEQMQEGDLVAIIRTGNGVGSLQQFTTDRRRLLAAIDLIRWNPAGVGGIDTFAPFEAKLPVGAISPPRGRTSEAITRGTTEFRESLFAAGTLGAINYVVRGMQDLPGRKSVMLLSDGFALYSTDDGSFSDSSRVLDSLHRLVDMANRAAVIINTIDARGLTFTGLTAMDDTSGRSEDLDKTLSARNSKLFNTQAGLVYLAKQTGGRSTIDNNDLSGSIRKVLDDQSYYLVGYQPESETFNPKILRYNKLEVKVKRPGLTVRYRSGFYNVSDEKIHKPEMTRGQRILSALTSPFGVDDISLRLNALFNNDVQQGTFIRSLLHIDAKDLTYRDAPGGSKKAAFDIVLIAIGEDGKPIGQLSKEYDLTLTPDIYDKVTRQGFLFDYTIPVKKAGPYQVRVALFDHDGDKIGSANQFIDVPNIKKDRLMLSGIYLENLTADEWKKRASGADTAAASNTGSNTLADTSIRQFKRGSILDYGFVIFNAKPDSAGKSHLKVQTRVFCDGKLLFEGAVKEVPTADQADPQRIKMFDSLNLGATILPGDYVLELMVTDELAKEKERTTSQYVQFEVVP